MKIYTILIFLILISCKNEIKTKRSPEQKLFNSGIEYVNNQISQQLGNDSIFINLIGMDSMSNINWQNVNPKIITLFFPESRISTLSMDFKKFSKLEKLWISKSQINDIPKSITHLKSLKGLYVYGSNINQIPKELCNMKSLTEIIIWRSKLRKLPSEMVKLENLKYLNLIENQISKVEQTKIQKMLPNCEIVFIY